MNVDEARAIRPGDRVELVGMSGKWFEVIGADDPALLRVRTEAGKEFSAGRVCVTQARHVDGSFLEGGQNESSH